MTASLDSSKSCRLIATDHQGIICPDQAPDPEDEGGSFTPLQSEKQSHRIEQLSTVDEEESLDDFEVCFWRPLNPILKRIWL